MNPFVEYLIYNWAMILVLIAFAIMLKVTVFLDKKTVLRMYVLIISVFLLSIIVFLEFYLMEIKQYNSIRVVMMAIRYSATPIIVAYILYTLVKKAHWLILVPSCLLIIFNVVSIFTGIVFSLDDAGELVRGPLGYLPYIGVGIYCFFLVFVLVKQSNKSATEIIPILFLSLSFITGIIFPFFMGKDYSRIFCTTVAISLFVYYVFLILQLTKKDPLTGLLNRQAFYSMIDNNSKEITAVLSIDMNGLKTINDKGGHDAGDKALRSVSSSFTRALKFRQSAFRIGGDEFIVLCKKTSEDEMNQLIERIEKNLSESPYSCSIGHCFCDDNSKSVHEMLKASDDLMYENKAMHYAEMRHKGFRSY